MLYERRASAVETARDAALNRGGLKVVRGSNVAGAEATKFLLEPFVPRGLEVRKVGGRIYRGTRGGRE